MRAFFAALILSLPLLAHPVNAGAFDGRARDGDSLTPSPAIPKAEPDSPFPGGIDPTDAIIPIKPKNDAAAEPDRGKRLDALYAALKAAPNAEAAKSIAERIDVALVPSGSDTADLLMSRAALATQAKEYDLAIQLLDGVLAVAPDHLDAWNRRATVFYLNDDFEDSLRDLQQVVAREPRHYGAWMGIALICKEIGDDKHALAAARQALVIYPTLQTAKDMEEKLAIEVEGRPI